MRALQERDGRLVQPVSVTVRHFGDGDEAQVRLGNGSPVPLRLVKDPQDGGACWPRTFESETKQTVTVEVGGKTVASRESS